MALSRFREGDSRIGYGVAVGTGTAVVPGQFAADFRGNHALADTYSASGTGYASYATATDMLSLIGSPTRTVVLLNILFGIQTGTAALQTLDFIKRSSASTGGTPTAQTAMPYDSSSPAATATVNLYAAAPTLGTSVGVHKTLYASSTLTSAAPNFLGPFGTNTYQALGLTMGDIRSPIILRGVAQSYNVNFKGAALPSGLTASWFVEWAEIDN